MQHTHIHILIYAIQCIHRSDKQKAQKNDIMDILELINVDTQQNANKQHRCDECNKAFGKYTISF